MSLQTRMAALITAIKGDFDSLDSRVTTLEGSGGGGGSVYSFMDRSSTDTSYANTPLLIPLDTAGDSYGTDVTWAGANNTRLTAGTSGVYEVGAVVAYHSPHARVQAALQVSKNGVWDGLFRGSGYVRNSDGWAYWVMEIAPRPINLTAGDYIEFTLANMGASGTHTTYDVPASPNGTVIFDGPNSTFWMNRVA
ncbi:hypothetical protein GCM10016455_05960 [Aliiroseovarius zhejiangensis]|uniref:Uncharacterized protein n=1 Tax=Aliiroseovarius zhejiangensis TaxID=1632025 RepID=A0ABQ3ISH3_9RHOB|nr:hypothetical protein [Aliiroseovarius zhejiangensis]GHE88631.1 hypothetical protein GCM10016455_05960 [Aliiroseovarius zhejiangensis]